LDGLRILAGAFATVSAFVGLLMAAWLAFFRKKRTEGVEVQKSLA